MFTKRFHASSLEFELQAFDRRIYRTIIYRVSLDPSDPTQRPNLTDLTQPSNPTQRPSDSAQRHDLTRSDPTSARMPSTGLQDDAPVPMPYRSLRLNKSKSSEAIASHPTSTQ